MPTAVLILAAAALVGSTGAAAAAPPKRPNPEQLWKVYPLDPKPAETRPETVGQPPAAETHAATSIERTSPATHAAKTVEQASPAPQSTPPRAVQPAAAPQPDRAHSGAPTSLVAAATAGALALVLVVAALVFVVHGSDLSTERPPRRGGRKRRERDPFPALALTGEDGDAREWLERRAEPHAAEDPSEVDVLRAKLPADDAPSKPELDVETDVDVLKAKREQRDRETAKTDTTPGLDALRAKRAVESPPKRLAPPAQVVEADVLRAKRQEASGDTVEALIAKLNADPDTARPKPKPVLRAVSDEPAGHDGSDVPAARVAPRPARKAKALERCSVHWGRGYVKSEFYATAEENGEVRPIATSPAFRWRRSEAPPERGAATRALAALVDQLEADGWRAVGRGNDWYALRFRRRPRAEGDDTDTSN